MELATLIKIVFLHASFALWHLNSAQEFAPLSRTANTLQNTFLKIAASSSSSSRRGRNSPPGPVELIFIIDKSGSIGRKNFALSLKFVQELTRFFSISPSTTRVAAISYSTSVRTEFQFNNYLNRECLTSAIRRIRYTAGATATGPALQQAITLFQSARRSAKKVVFLLTDGKSNRGVKPSIPAAQLKNSGVDIFVLGIGNNVNVLELKSIASSNNNVFRVRNFVDLQRLINALRQKPRDVCRGRGKKLDECGRRCSCVRGKLVNCCRVRKDFPSMSAREKELYVKAYKTMTTQQPYKRKYDALVNIHRTFFQTPIHEQREFLPWHRYYLLQLENILREVDCRVTVPYWDWSLWSHDPWSANAIWSPIAHRGLGGNGNPARDFCVTTGPFREGAWQTERGQCLRRDFNGNVPDAVQVQFCLNLVPFVDFEIFLRLNLHNLVHVSIGGFEGQMSFVTSANVPEFNLHHCFVDKIWHDWQKKSSANFNAFFPGINTRMTQTPYFPRDFINLQRQPGCVKVCYDDPFTNNARSITAFLRRLSVAQLQTLKRSSFSMVTKQVTDMFKPSKHDQTRAKEMEMSARKGVVASGQKVDLTSTIERIVGFKLSIINRPTLNIRPLRRSDAEKENDVGDDESSVEDDVGDVGDDESYVENDASLQDDKEDSIDDSSEESIDDSIEDSNVTTSDEEEEDAFVDDFTEDDEN
ncbi:uncharacterized protein [Clytia hemisphaerica]|uniref:VWFA domain-containing protein n=1 Tax=Clytia hemisphaerica TaxID=252671 RepID=A0A7M6DMJ9_9CNID